MENAIILHMLKEIHALCYFYNYHLFQSWKEDLLFSQLNLSTILCWEVSVKSVPCSHISPILKQSLEFPKALAGVCFMLWLKHSKTHLGG